MTATAPLADGREAFQRHKWQDAYDALRAAESGAPLAGDDLDRLGRAAYLTGRDAEAHHYLERAHRAFAAADDAREAARSAFWLGMLLLNRGDAAQGSGWLARAARLLDDEHDCAERGYLLIPRALQVMNSGDTATAVALFGEAADIGDRHGEADLVALARLGHGEALVARGEVDAGMTLLDEAMVSVQAGEVSAIPAGVVYCAVIEVCQEIYDLRRAQEWTAALTAWCERQPDLVPYRGQCLVHRAEILQMRGEWPAALDEALSACAHLSDPPGQPALGAAHYRLGELHRLRGEAEEAEAAYRAASQHGHLPQPGLALLRLAQGRTDAARAAIRRTLDESPEIPLCVRLLAASVEVELAAGDAAAARIAADELSALAEGTDAPPLRAVADHVVGAVLIVEGEPRAALASLRAAWTVWQSLDAPYEAARARVLLGMACRELGDIDGADLEFEAARAVFEDLGAAAELVRLRELSAGEDVGPPGGLTPREREVIRLIADGRSNRDIAAQLVISEHTVARHVQNILVKLGVGSRTAAAAFAYEHGLASRPSGRF